MKGFVINLEKETIENTDYRRVLYTAKNSQLVLMSIDSGDEIGSEVHELDQFIRVEAGKGKAIMDGVEHELEDGSAIVIPAGMEHNVVNIGEDNLKLYSVYAPPEHKDETVHIKKSDEQEEHFDGKTTE